MAEKPPDFQTEAVNRIVARLNDPAGSLRFLLADEVGLGKTRVAAGVIKTLRENKRGGFTVVYVCSNSEIAEQNRQKLCPESDASAVTRLTLLATRSTEVQRARETGELQLFSFTPGTSFHVGGATGIKYERLLLLYLLARVWRKHTNRQPWRTFFCCSSKIETWLVDSTFRKTKKEFSGKVASELQRRLKNEWDEAKIKPINHNTGKESAKPVRLKEIVDEFVATFDPHDQVARKNRNLVIGELRNCLAKVAVDFLEPDLIVLDEFQRFSEILEECIDRNSVVGRLFARQRVAALILSATPYKWYTLAYEKEDHHKDFIRTLKFLFKCVKEEDSDPNYKPIKRLRENLQQFKDRLMKGEWFKEPDEMLIKLKMDIESDLKAVMCRTERNWYLEGRKKGVEEFGEAPLNVNPSICEFSHYIRLRSFLLGQKIDDWNITDFWKSAPSPLTFMDGHYALLKRIRDRRVQVPEQLLLTGMSLSKSSGEHLKVQTLVKKVFGTTPGKLRYLWVKPSYTYYKDEFYDGGDPAKQDDPTYNPVKFLIFSHWKFVPKTISVLLSQEAEKRLVIRRRGRETIPLQFRRKTSFSPFEVSYPSLPLADCINPAELALAHAGKLTAEEFYARAEQSVRCLLGESGIAIGKTRTVPLWRIVARIEAKSKWAKTIETGLWESKVSVRDELSDQYYQYQNLYSEWMSDLDEELEISPTWLRRLTMIALNSPAICLLRSMRSVFGDVPNWENRNWSGVLNLGLNQLRNYFNRPVVQSIIRANSSRERSYAVKVLDYCGLAHFQAMLDEYAYLVRMALPQAKPEKLPSLFLAQLTRVFGMGTGSPSVNVLTREGRVRKRPTPRPAHFAVAFGDDVSTDDLEPGGRTRKTAMREAFNSPFWPFILATTSVGQEGLDFHLFCRDIMHWNLPSNPVDLEQREGRINRYDGLSIRRNIAKDHPLSSIAEVSAESQNLWSRLFEVLKRHPKGTQRFKHGLYPHWIYQPATADGHMIRRHLAFYSKSRDAIRYGELKRALTLYRLVFGQPRQQDIIESLLKMFPEAAPTEIDKKLAKYTINLSPIPKGHAARIAEQEAGELINDPLRLSLTLAEVRSLMERESTKELKPIVKEVENLMTLASDGSATSSLINSRRIQAITVLLYLLNPYDDLYDFHDGVGYQDDIEKVRQVHAALFATTGKCQTY
jgi:uncharacterized membrane protein YkvA (DUF1232 family)